MEQEAEPELSPMATTTSADNGETMSLGSQDRKVYSLADFPDLPKPKRKVVQTFFGVVSE